MMLLFHWQTLLINSLTFLLVGIAIFYAYTHSKSQSFGNIFISENAASTNVYRIGNSFQLAWNHGNISIYDTNDMDHPIWYTVSKQPFLEVSWNNLHGDPIYQGHLLLKESIVKRTKHMSIDSINYAPRLTSSTFEKEENSPQQNDEKTFCVTFSGQLSTFSKWKKDHNPLSNPGIDGKPEEPTSLDKLTLIEEKGLTIGYQVWICPDEVDENKLKFSVELPPSVDVDGEKSPVNSIVNRIYLRYGSEPDEAIFGFGEQYSEWNMKGKRLPVLISEQGIGRGLQPLTFILNTGLNGVGSDWHTTYMARPLYTTSKYRGFILNTGRISIFDMRPLQWVEVEIWDSSLEAIIFKPTSGLPENEKPMDLITTLTTVTGRMKKLPDWTQNGAIIALQGGGNEAKRVTKKLQEASIPLVGVWIQDWPGLRNDWDGTRLIWNWQVNRNHYDNWDEYLQDLEKNNIKMMTYLNPYVVDTEHLGRAFYDMKSADFKFLKEHADYVKRLSKINNGSEENVQNNDLSLSVNASGVCLNEQTCNNNGAISSKLSSIFSRNLVREGLENDYFVKGADGLPFVTVSGSVEFYTVDATNPRTRKWFKEIIKEEVVKDAHSTGWMADFGEYIPVGAQLYAGSGADLHNDFAEHWASLQKEAIDEMKEQYNNDGENKETKRDERGLPQIDPNEIVYFSRSGSLNSVGVTQLYWTGDQLVTWDRHDGIKSGVLAMLSSGISGASLQHNDIGGYTMIDHQVFWFMRPKELLLRWIELGAFGGAVFRTHVGSCYDTPSHQVWDDIETLQHTARFASYFQMLKPYRNELMEEAETKGWPLIRSLWLHYPNSVTMAIKYQFMLGESLLVCPVLDSHKTNQRCYLPQQHSSTLSKVDDEIWVHLWTGTEYSSNKSLDKSSSQSVSTADGKNAGAWVEVRAPIGEIPVFYKKGFRYTNIMEEIKLLNNGGR